MYGSCLKKLEFSHKSPLYDCDHRLVPYMEVKKKRKCVFSFRDLQIEAHAWYARHVALTLCVELNNKANILAESEVKQFPDPH